MLLLTTLIAIILTLPQVIFADILHVTDDYETIGEAIEAAEDGDTVLIEPGRYLERLNFEGKAITVASLFLTTGDQDYILSTMIDGSEGDGGRVITFINDEDENSILCGLTIQGGLYNWGGGLYIRRASPTLKNLIVANNRAGRRGGGVYCTTDAHPTLINVTVVGNVAVDAGGGIRTYNEAAATLINCIFWGNDPPDYNEGLEVTFSNMESGHEGEGNIEEDPDFVDEDEGDFNLQPGSPCIDSGDPDSPEDPDGSRADMGALSLYQLPEIAIDPDNIDFGQLHVGLRRDMELIIENIGSVVLTVTSITLDPEEGPVTLAGGGDGAELDPGDEYNVLLRFTPVEEGQVDATLRIESNDPEREQIDVPIVAIGLPPIPQITVDRRLLEYGEVAAYRGSVDGEIVVGNIGHAPLDVTGITIAGDDADDFSVGEFQQFQVAPNEEETITVTFSPSSTGEKNAILTIESNDPVEGEWTVSLNGVGIMPEVHYEFIDNTGINHSMLILDATMDGEQLAIGNDIAVFTDEDLCCGAGLWMGEMLGLVAWGDNEVTEEIDGFEDGGEIEFRFWDFATDEETVALPNYENGDEAFRENGVSVLELHTDFEPPQGFAMVLIDGWNQISAPVDPVSDNVVDIWRPMVQRDNLIIVKNDMGRFYMPAIPFNNIPRWDFRQGYQARVLEVDTLYIDGEIVAEDTPIPLRINWSMCAYLPEQELDAITAFANVRDELIIAKDGRGRFYLVAIGWSNMGNLRRGQGYWVRTSEAVDLVWNVPDRVNRIRTVEPREPAHFNAPEPTGVNMSLLIKETSLTDGCEVGVFGSSGRCFGAAVLSGAGPTGVAIWGDDPSTDFIDGAVEGEALRIAVWTNETEVEVNFDWVEGNGLYHTDGLAIVTLDEVVSIPAKFGIESVHPNPFNSSLKIRFTLENNSFSKLSIFDVNGREITVLSSGNTPAGTHDVTWEAGDIPTGVYLARLSSPEGVRTVKVTLLR